jgi:hypothetical protein
MIGASFQTSNQEKLSINRDNFYAFKDHVLHILCAPSPEMRLQISSGKIYEMSTPFRPNARDFSTDPVTGNFSHPTYSRVISGFSPSPVADKIITVLQPVRATGVVTRSMIPAIPSPIKHSPDGLSTPIPLLYNDEFLALPLTDAAQAQLDRAMASWDKKYDALVKADTDLCVTMLALISPESIKAIQSATGYRPSVPDIYHNSLSLWNSIVSTHRTGNAEVTNSRLVSVISTSQGDSTHAEYMAMCRQGYEFLCNDIASIVTLEDVGSRMINVNHLSSAAYLHGINQVNCSHVIQSLIHGSTTGKFDDFHSLMHEVHRQVIVTEHLLPRAPSASSALISSGPVSSTNNPSQPPKGMWPDKSSGRPSDRVPCSICQGFKYYNSMYNHDVSSCILRKGSKKFDPDRYAAAERYLARRNIRDTSVPSSTAVSYRDTKAYKALIAAVDVAPSGSSLRANLAAELAAFEEFKGADA